MKPIPLRPNLWNHLPTTPSLKMLRKMTRVKKFLKTLQKQMKMPLKQMWKMLKKLKQMFWKKRSSQSQMRQHPKKMSRNQLKRCQSLQKMKKKRKKNLKHKRSKAPTSHQTKKSSNSVSLTLLTFSTLPRRQRHHLLAWRRVWSSLIITSCTLLIKKAWMVTLPRPNAPRAPIATQTLSRCAAWMPSSQTSKQECKNPFIAAWTNTLRKPTMM